MKKSKVAILVAGALVAGLTLGGLGIADAAVRAAHKTVASQSSNVAKGLSPVVTLSRMTKLSVKQITALRNQGTSFASIATSNGVDPAAVIDQMIAARQTHLDAMVAAGHMTAAQEQTMLSAMRTGLGTMMGFVPGSGRGMMSGDDTQSVPATGTPGYALLPSIGHTGEWYGAYSSRHGSFIPLVLAGKSARATIGSLASRASLGALGRRRES